MEVLKKLRALIFPERCPLCGGLIEEGEIACKGCLDEINQKHIPIIGGAGGFRCVSSFIYGGKVRKAIVNIKFRERTQYIPQFAKIMAEDIREAYGGTYFDIITAVPMHKADLKERGYNQSVLLAKALSKLLDIPYEDTLVKVKRTKKQHKLSWAERKKNLSGAFKTIDNSLVHGKTILLIDDIVTSGNTLGKCAKILNRAKPKGIFCATIAAARNYYPEVSVI